MSNLKLVIVIAVIALLGIFGVVQSGLFNVAATEKDGPLLTWFLHTTMERSVAKRARDIESPDLNSRELILAGVSDYVGMCAQCHGEPGKQAGALTQGLNPAPPDLKALAEDGTAAEKFWIITNGIRMTGMPAFGKTHKPDDIWPVVAFLQSAGNLDAADYNRLVAESKSYGHHAAAEGRELEHDNDSHEHPESDVNGPESMPKAHSHSGEAHEVEAEHHNSEDAMSPNKREEQLPETGHAHSPDAGEHSH